MTVSMFTCLQWHVLTVSHRQTHILSINCITLHDVHREINDLIRRIAWPTISVWIKNGFIEDANTFNCVLGECQGTQQYPEVLPPPTPIDSPAVSQSAGSHQSISAPESAPPKYHFIPEFVSPSCRGHITVADRYDCSRYWKCDSSGKFYSMACPSGSVYDPQERTCTQGKCSSTKCVERSFQPSEECGVYKTCYKGEWIEARCDHGKQFVNGKCTNDDCVREERGEEYYSMLQCHSGAVRPHHTSRASYMFCQYGVWTPRSCPDGAIFDWKTLACVTTSKSPSYHPKCFEGETKSIPGQCSLYKECQNGKWVKKACPYGYRFYNGYCMEGNCSEENQYCKESSGVDGYRRVQHDCSKYYQCVHGKWLERPCAPGTVFNGRISVCDHATNVPECGGIYN
ncbi:chitin binding Peritrophin-A domain protein [Necator americanus]|uniref:Chitin binding Peritrophin-A domain protein n=1 Tax=Necator americanus TaxID=51031 RepID=W2TH22_NECAM|nr:chitin binding Peritrophin-A domain protein [Necator americanus]ETN81345.1 chitin binding Peritrophin-A domain protein [Necator americanus]